MVDHCPASAGPTWDVIRTRASLAAIHTTLIESPRERRENATTLRLLAGPGTGTGSDHRLSTPWLWATISWFLRRYAIQSVPVESRAIIGSPTPRGVRTTGNSGSTVQRRLTAS